jgi:3-hydroxyisobutyrate dehydrogenase
MGSAMAERLMEEGHEVSVWNRTAERAQPLLDQGAHFAFTKARAVFYRPTSAAL